MGEAKYGDFLKKKRKKEKKRKKRALAPFDTFYFSFSSYVFLAFVVGRINSIVHTF